MSKIIDITRNTEEKIGEYLFPKGSTYFPGQKYWGSTLKLGNMYWGSTFSQGVLLGRYTGAYLRHYGIQIG